MNICEFSPQLGDDEVKQVLDVLGANWITEGKKTALLENMLAEFFGCKRVIMVPNGTLALFAALKILDIGPGDEVIVPDFTFFGSASAVILTGAKPVLVDVDEFDGNILIESARASLSEKTKAIMPVHMYGQSCDMQSVRTLADQHDLFIVEDAAQGMGVTFGNRHVGTLGDIGCMSFFADKTMTTGEGGALLLNDEALIKRAIYFKNQGRIHRGSFVHGHVGFNFRITDLQAAIGVAQMARVRETIARKRALQAVYYAQLRDCPGVRLPASNGFGDSVPFRVNILVDDPKALAEFLADSNIATRRYFYPLHRQPSLTPDNSVVRDKIVNADKLYDSGLMLPSGLNLTGSHIDMVCSRIRAFQEAAYKNSVQAQSACR